MARKNRLSDRITMPAQQSDAELNPHAEPAPAQRERVAARAYELYLERGARHGRETEDWLTAERELSSSPDRRNGRPDEE